MDPSSITPFAKVLKDGYYEVECVRDYMFEHGDKFADNKFSYALGDVSNVSIVHYTSLVPKEDRQPMTHDTCFAFCRTVPDMLFFGILNGRECYCTPYYKPMASDSSSCDAVCEGDATTMCGGKTKSSVFAMHQCTDTATDLADTTSKMKAVATAMSKLATNLTQAVGDMQGLAGKLQQSFGNVGDVAATGLMQSAKVFAGELNASVKSAVGINAKVDELNGKKAAMAGADYTTFQHATDAEDLIQQMEKVTADGEAQGEAMGLLHDAVMPSGLPAGALAQYYPVMYFVDRNKTGLPSTCAGDSAAQPQLLGTVDECAASCDTKQGDCVGFSYFSHADGDLCFLFSRLVSATYYSGCAASFLQRVGAGANATQCMAKLQYFSGTTLAPDGSGKCKQCLKKVDEANRCFQ